MSGFDDPVEELPTSTKLHDEVNISATKCSDLLGIAMFYGKFYRQT
jgi:hypothetical protein